MNTAAGGPASEHAYGVREQPEDEHIPFLGIQSRSEARLRGVTRVDREHGMHIREKTGS
jgi:hypothetical protein